MHRDKRVVAWVPYGRERTVSILHKYLLMDRAIDEIWLCMNLDPGQDADRAYAEALAEEHEKIVLYERPSPTHGVEGMPAHWSQYIEQPKQMNTGRFVFYMQDPETVFLRFDDDIVWVHPDTPTRLVDRVLDDRLGTLGVFALIYNNAISSWFLQQHNRIPLSWGAVGQGLSNPHMISAVDPTGWQDGQFAIKLHGLVLDALEDGRDDDLQLDAEMGLGQRQQFSVSCFGISGEEYAVLGGLLDWAEEEHWLTQFRPSLVGKANVVCGMAPVSHLSFYTQTEIHNTDILDRYRVICERKWREWYLGQNYYQRILEAP